MAQIKDLKAYKEGYKASVKCNSNVTLAQNPYPLNTESWRSWNAGWNSDNSYCDKALNPLGRWIKYED